jgi:hypothetical protein
VYVRPVLPLLGVVYATPFVGFEPPHAALVVGTTGGVHSVPPGGGVPGGGGVSPGGTSPVPLVGGLSPTVGGAGSLDPLLQATPWTTAKRRRRRGARFKVVV